LLPPLGFGLWAKTRRGTLEFPGCIRTGTKNRCWKSKKCWNERSILDLTKLGTHGCLGYCRVLATKRSRFVTFQLRHLLAASSSVWRSCIYELYFLPMHCGNFGYCCCNGSWWCFPQKISRIYWHIKLPVTQKLIARCNKFILTRLWVNRLQIIVFSTNTLLQVWLLLYWFLVNWFFFSKIIWV